MPRSTCEGIPNDRKGTPKGKGESKDKEAPQFPGVKYNVALINHGRKRGRHGDLYIADLYNLPVTIILACEMDHHTHTEKLHITDRSPPPSPAIATARLHDREPPSALAELRIARRTDHEQSCLRWRTAGVVDNNLL